jgi:long-chain acyl-CoA synthetase
MMPPKPVAAPSGLHLHSCLSALPRLAKAGEIERVNAQFARVEQVKQFRIIDRVLTPEDEEITATTKLKRKFVHQKFSEGFSISAF